jgi:hypothetical protein
LRLPQADGALRLEGSVAFTVDGPRGRSGGVVSGDGPVLRVTADDPVAAWDAAVGSAPRGPGALGTVADLLAAQGLSVEVDGPRGRLATVGAGVDSGVGRAVTGSRRVAPGRPAALRPLVVAQLRTGVARQRGRLLVAAVLAVLLLGRRARRAGAAGH